MQSNNISKIEFPENGVDAEFNSKMTLDIQNNPIRQIPIEFLQIIRNFRTISSSHGSYEATKKN